MPNWCYNRMYINTTNESGKILAAAFKPSKVDDEGRLYATPFQDLMPCPEELHCEAGFFGNGSEKAEEMQKLYAANKEKYGYAHWYDWQIAHWGVKWDARVEDYDDSDPDETSVYFETPWGAPTEFFRHFSEKYPDARYEDEYDEEGMQFEGKVGMSDVGFFDESWDTAETEEEFLED
jgi:hypothetical protein